MDLRWTGQPDGGPGRTEAAGGRKGRRAGPRASLPATAALACAILATFGSAGAARAGSCGNPSGSVILDDRFADNHNGWPKNDTAKFSPDGLTLILNPRYNGYFYTNPAVQAHDADYCLEAVMPTIFGEKNLTAVGLLFLYENDKNYWSLVLFGNGIAQVEHLLDGKRLVPFNEAVPGDPKPGDVVALRARVRDGQIRFLADGAEMTLIKTDLPVGDLSFGPYVHKDVTPEPALAFTFERLVVAGVP